MLWFFFFLLLATSAFLGALWTDAAQESTQNCAHLCNHAQSTFFFAIFLNKGSRPSFDKTEKSTKVNKNHREKKQNKTSLQWNISDEDQTYVGLFFFAQWLFAVACVVCCTEVWKWIWFTPRDVYPTSPGLNNLVTWWKGYEWPIIFSWYTIMIYKCEKQLVEVIFAGRGNGLNTTREHRSYLVWD